MTINQLIKKLEKIREKYGKTLPVVVYKEGVKNKYTNEDYSHVNVEAVDVESKTGAIGGVQYQRLLTDRISVGVQGQTNDSVLLNVGLEF